MQGKKQYLDKEVTRFRLSERVPPHNLYRRLADVLDWTFLYDETRGLYSHTGQPSLDPVVFFKLLLVGRLENLVSDRRLIEHCALRLDILLFLGYEVDEELPWHSTVSRTRQLFPAAVFERLFDHVFGQCVAQGLVAGDRRPASRGLGPGQSQCVIGKYAGEATARSFYRSARRRGPIPHGGCCAASGCGALGPRPSVAPRSCPASQAPNRAGGLGRTARKGSFGEQ